MESLFGQLTADGGREHLSDCQKPRIHLESQLTLSNRLAGQLATWRGFFIGFAVKKTNIQKCGHREHEILLTRYKKIRDSTHGPTFLFTCLLWQHAQFTTEQALLIIRLHFKIKVPYNFLFYLSVTGRFSDLKSQQLIKVT